MWFFQEGTAGGGESQAEKGQGDLETVRNYTELFEKLYEDAVANGVDSVRYWDMTFAEIITAIRGNQKAIKRDMQVQASMIHNLGSLVGFAVNEPAKYPNIKKVFPNLFDDFGEKEEQQPWQVMKERLNDYNDYLKRKRGER